MWGREVEGYREWENKRRRQGKESGSLSLCVQMKPLSFANVATSQLICKVRVMQLMSLFKLDKIIVSLAGNLLILWLCHLLFSKPAASVAFVEEVG